MQSGHTNYLYVITLALCLGLVNLASAADEDGRRYPQSANALADVQQALDRAADDDRLLLVVAGANWCHDSRALAARLGRSPLTELVQEQYELVFVNVGYYDQGRGVMQRFGVAHYYATPTVLIVDPVSGQLINDADRHQWGNAYNIDMSDSVQYFQEWSEREAPVEAVEDSAELRQLNQEIDDFEQQLADRLVAGYAVVGPLLEATDGGNRPADFDANWNELRKFRSAIPPAIQELRTDARRRVSAGEQDIELTYPEFAPLSWEAH